MRDPRKIITEEVPVPGGVILRRRSVPRQTSKYSPNDKGTARMAPRPKKNSSNQSGGSL